MVLFFEVVPPEFYESSYKEVGLLITWSWNCPAEDVLMAHRYDAPTGDLAEAFLMMPLRAEPSSVAPSRVVTRKRPSAML